MGKIRTNIMEILLREILIGKQFYDKNDVLRTIEDLDYQPFLKTVYILSGGDGYYFSIDDFYEFELNQSARPRIIPNKGRVNKIK